MKALIRIAQYLDCTAHYRLAFWYPDRPVRVLTLFTYSDADMARDTVNTAKSYSGMVIYFCGMLLHYGTVRQSITETSSAGSEYIAASTAAQRTVSVMFMLTEMFGHLQHNVATLPPADSVLDAHIQYIDRVATDIDFDYPGLQPGSILAKLLAYTTSTGTGVGGVRPGGKSITDELHAYSESDRRPLHYQNMRSREYLEQSATCPRLELPIPILLDNDACRSITENQILSQKIKHVLVRFHMLRDFVRLGWIICWRVPSEKNLADPYTKPVPPVKDSQPYFSMLFDSYMDMRKAALQAARTFGFRRWSHSESSSKI